MKIAIKGCPGSGKSTLARQLGHALDLPVHHLDSYHWKPGWTEADPDTFRAEVQELLAQSEWIIDGGYSVADPDEVRYRSVDILILFDRSVWLCLWRVFKRMWMYRSRSRPDMGAECPERVDWDFIVYIWNYRKATWPRILERVERNKTPVIFLREDQDIATLVAEIRQRVGAG